MTGTIDAVVQALEEMTAAPPAESRGSLENPSTSIASSAAWLTEILGGGGPAYSGAVVSPKSAMTLSTVWACVRLLAETIGCLPLGVFEQTDRAKRPAPDHPLHRVLHDEANPDMSAQTFRETLQGHWGLWGSGYAFIERNGGAFVTALRPLEPERVRPVRENGRKVFKYQPADGGEQTLRDIDVLHIPGLGYDGIRSYSPIEMARQVFGRGLAVQEFGSRFFGNGANAGGVISFDKEMSEKAIFNLRESFAAKQAGLANSHKPIILENGGKWQQTTVPPETAQFLETGEFSIEEICRWYNVPPHMVQHLKRATFSNIEHQAIQFVVYTIMPHLVRWEQEINRKLLLPSERPQYYVKFTVAGLLRGDAAARSTYYREQFNVGALSQNEIRELEDRNPIEGGDEYYVPTNMGNGDAPPARTTPGTPPASKPADVRSSLRPVFADALRRIARREQEVLAKAARRTAATDVAAAAERFLDGHAEYVRGALAPAAAAAGDDVAEIATRYVGRCRDEVMAAVLDGTLEACLEQRARRVDETAGEMATAGK